MFDIGFWELVLVGVVSLLVLGPERLPGAVRTAVRLLHRARHLMAQVRADIERELALDEVKRSLEQERALDELKRLERELRQPVKKATAQPLPKIAAEVDDDSPRP
ncbi:MAG: Sec-independent protein translocase protein TatB [Methylohalobius sp.]|nr:Sec-independent protein translocase protein TatB [Methylohalobius sp.]